MVIRGTPFIAAVIMSAAAMLLMPNMVSTAKSPEHRPPRAGTAMDANLDEDAAIPPPVQAVAPAPAGTARTLRTGQVNLNVAGFWSWALIDRRTGTLSGSENAAARSDTASMVKSWIAADYLRRAGERGVEDSRLRSLSQMIRDSDNSIANTFHGYNGGTPSINRMIRICGLTDSRPVSSGSWSTTEVSARDGARLAVCLADGRAAGPKWTNWLLNEMRQVRGAGRFGIVTAFPPDVAAKVAVKNGWINRDDGKWHIACLAVTDDWALSVLTQYPVAQGMQYGANICKQVAVQLGTTT
jgi:hypothetical protein